MNVMKQRDKKYNGGISLLRSTHLLLLLLLLSGGTHLLAESHVGDLKTGNGADTDVEDGEEEDADNTAHEDSYETMSAESNTRLELGVIKRTR
jgi:tRNA A37 N6-isopentenylltransferase MiaA